MLDELWIEAGNIAQHVLIIDDELLLVIFDEAAIRQIFHHAVYMYLGDACRVADIMLREREVDTICHLIVTLRYLVFCPMEYLQQEKGDSLHRAHASCSHQVVLAQGHISRPHLDEAGRDIGIAQQHLFDVFSREDAEYRVSHRRY